MGSTLEKKIGEKIADIRVESNFPWEGDVKITIRAKDTGLKLALRIPDWCSRYELDGFTGGTEEKDGYLYLQKRGRRIYASFPDGGSNDCGKGSRA